MRRASPQQPDRAIALEYDGRGAPRVTAKGEGEIAERIVATAREHGVPINEDAGLAGLLAEVDLGTEIPPELYVAVAQVLAFAYRVAGRAPPPRDRSTRAGGAARQGAGRSPRLSPPR